MRLVLPGLFIESLQDLIGIGIHIEVHLLIIVLQKVSRIAVEHLVDLVVGFQIASLPWDDVDYQMFERPLVSVVLDVDGGGGAGVEAFHGSGQYFECECEIEDLDGF